MNKEAVLGSVVIKQDITRQLVDDLMCTAFDGGYGGAWWWIDDFDMLYVPTNSDAEYFHDNISRGADMKIKVKEPFEDGVDTYYLTLQKVLNGIQIFCEKRASTPAKLADDHDSIDADLIIQYALFGDDIYG